MARNIEIQEHIESVEASQQGAIMSAEERQLLEVLDSILNQDSVRATIDAVVREVELELLQKSAALMAWQPIPLSIYGGAIPPGIRSSWVFILRNGATTGAERHPNSHQRVMSYRGSGDLQIFVDDQWRSNKLVSDSKVSLAERWASIPVNDWHQAVVHVYIWAVVTFLTTVGHEWIE